MFISPISNTQYKYNRVLKNKDATSLYRGEEANQSSAICHSQFNFKSGICNGYINNLLKNYRWFINVDKQPAINSFLKISAPKESMETLLRTILKDDGMSYELIDSIVKQPRNIKRFLADFDEKLPYGTDILLTFMPQNPYKQAYKKYIDTRLNNAESISELLQIRPDWRENILIAKHQEIYHNNNFELGHIPEEINHGKFETIVQYLRQYMDIGYKIPKQIPTLQTNGTSFNFHFFTEGRSDKNVFGIETGSGEKFIIKIADTSRRGLNAPFALGTLCKIDTYLTRNYCRNSAPFRYYNHNLNSSVYDFIEHKKINQKPTLEMINRNIPDFIDLHMKYNDTVGSNNFFVLDNSQKHIKGMNDYNYGVEKSEWITVDNDHVTFECCLHPKLEEYHTQLPVQIIL